MLAIALGLSAGAARAHELTCQETANGKRILQVSQYPVDVRFDWTITNVFQDQTSVMTSLTDSVLFPANSLGAPVPIDPGASITGNGTLTIHSFDQCKALGTWSDQLGGFVVENVLTAAWQMGEFQCRARVVCVPQCAPPPTDGSCAVNGTCSPSSM